MKTLLLRLKSFTNTVALLVASGMALYGASMRADSGQRVDQFCLNTTPGIDPLSAFARGGCGLLQHSSIGVVNADGTFAEGCTIEGCGRH